MKKTTFTRAVLLLCTVAVAFAVAQPAGQSARPARRGLYGDWQLKVQFGERQMGAILSFSRDNEGNRTAQWISPWGMTQLRDLKFQENKLSFVHVVRFGDNEFTSNFTGSIEEGKLTGILSSDRGESKVEGQRSPRIPRAVGSWTMTFTAGDREVTTTLVIKADKEGELTGEWQSQWGEHEVTDVAYERGNLTFKRKSKFQDREWESTFEGTVRGDTLSGTIKSQMGDIAAEGARVGAALIGTWNLEVTGEWGTIKQRLRVNPDMSALYGTIPVEKVGLEDGRVSFKMVVEFRDQQFEMSFAGKMDESKLTGEMTTSRGTQKVIGTKVVRPPRRPDTR